MKIIATFLIAVSLSGCAVIDKVRDYWPRDHDPVLASMYINLDRELEKASCDKQERFGPLVDAADWINRYAEFRNDPQKVATKNVRDNLEKASTSSEAVCKRYLNLTKINMKLIRDSWSGR